MFSSKNKLKKEDFLIIKRLKPQILSSNFFNLKFFNSVEKIKFGVTVSSKTFPKATQRNLVKRKIFSSIISSQKPPNGFYLFQPKPIVLKSKKQEIVQEINKIFSDLTKKLEVR